MVTPEELSTLDLLVWLRNSQNVASRLGINQSTVSRRVAHCSEVFQLKIKRVGGEWNTIGNTLLLAMERQVHQLHRLLGREPLRLECDLWNVPALCCPLPPGWIAGSFDQLRQRPLALLRERVIDAWISNFYPDVPNAEDPDLVTFLLTRFPLWLMADRHHPLAGERGLQPGDLERFPSLALPPGEMPIVERVLQAQGLWNEPVRMQRYCPEDWEGRTADRVTLSFGNTIGHRLFPELVPLDRDLGHQNGQALVVRRDVAEKGPIQMLLELLQSRSAALRSEHPQLEPLGSVAL